MNEQLPDGWVEVELKSVVELVMGQSPESSTYNDHGEGLPFFQGKAEFGELYPTVRKWCSEPGKVAQANDVLLSVRAPVGALNMADQTCCIGRGLAAIRLQKGDNKFLYYALQTREAQQFMSESATGSTFVAISKSVVEEIKIPLPPLAEQARIVTVLDGLLGRVRTAQEQLATIPKLLKRFRHGVLSAAVSGKLTEAWREENPSIASWEKKLAADSCETIASGSTPKGRPFFAEGEIPYLKVYNIVNQQINFFYKPQFITRKIHEKELKRCRVYPNDVIINIVGPPLGKVALMPDYFKEWNINQAIVVFRPLKEVLMPRYLYYIFCEGSHFTEIETETRGTAGQTNISLTQCRAFLLNVPPLIEQDEIVRRVSGLLNWADKLEEGYREAKRQLDAMPAAILSKAFSGELTEQSSTDEPASLLLERIRAERLAAQQQPKEKKKPTTEEIPKRRKKMAEQLRSITEILTNTNAPLPAHTVWQQSIHKDDIEGFYAELKQLVDIHGSVIDVKEGEQTYLKLADAN